MASSDGGPTETRLDGSYHCEQCGNDIRELFFTTTNHEPDTPFYVTCDVCGLGFPVPQSSLRSGVQKRSTSADMKQDPAGGATAGKTPSHRGLPAMGASSAQLLPVRKISKGTHSTTSVTESSKSKKQKLSADSINGLKSSTHSLDSNMNLQVDFAEARSNFFSQTCPCGCSDRSDFFFVTDNEDDEILMRECKQCGDMIGIDDTTPYDNVLSWIDDSAQIHVSICDCGNENPDKFVFELLNDDIVLKCGVCEKIIPVSNLNGNAAGGVSAPQEVNANVECAIYEANVDCVIDDSMKRPLCANVESLVAECTCATSATQTSSTEAPEGCACAGHPCGRTKIDPTSASKFNPGDHLGWHRPLGYWHHAIIVRCSSIADTTVRVIHYAEPTSKSTCKGTVIEEWIDLRKQLGDLYRIEYRPRTFYSGDVVIERGRSRLGEVQYNIFDNNCEHFALWCKTGVGKSEQVETLCASLKRIGHKSLAVMGGNTMRHLIGRAISAVPPKRWMVKMMPSWNQMSSKVALAGSSGGAVVSKNTGTELVRKHACCSVVTGAVAFTVVMGIEVYSLYRDLKKVLAQRREGDISEQVFVNIVVKRACRSIGGVVGATTGTIVPIPVIGTLIGCTLGSLIGEGVGALAGRHTSALVAKRRLTKAGEAGCDKD